MSRLPDSAIMEFRRVVTSHGQEPDGAHFAGLYAAVPLVVGAIVNKLNPREVPPNRDDQMRQEGYRQALADMLREVSS